MVLQLNAEKDRILVDKVQIEQVLINLIRNAEEAISASNNRELTISTSLDKDMIRTDIIDTGPGLPKRSICSNNPS